MNNFTIEELKELRANLIHYNWEMCHYTENFTCNKCKYSGLCKSIGDIIDGINNRINSEVK